MISVRRAPVTMAIMIVIVIVFIVEIATNALDPSSDMIVTLGAIRPGLLENHEYWRLLTAMFLHGGFLHVAVNLWAIYQLATLYEVMFGSARLAFVYFATGLAASVTSALHVNGLSVGASGAIFGLLGAFIFSIRRSPRWRHEKWTRGLLNQLVLLGILNLLLGYKYRTLIDNYAHIGGLVAGLILGFLPHRVPPPPPSQIVIEAQPQQGGPA
jgi:rhomboid protease GluP